MKTIVSVLLILTFVSCKEQGVPVQAEFSLEEQINAEKPINAVVVLNPSSGNWTFRRSGWGTDGNPLYDANAEHGFLIVTSVSKHFFNLAQAKQIMISSNTIEVRY